VGRVHVLAGARVQLARRRDARAEQLDTRSVETERRVERSGTLASGRTSRRAVGIEQRWAL